MLLEVWNPDSEIQAEIVLEVAAFVATFTVTGLNRIQVLSLFILLFILRLVLESLDLDVGL